MPHHPHHETGISDEAAMEAHDIFEQAEEEENKLHSQISNESSQSTSQARMGDMGKTMPTSGSPTDKPGFEKMKKNMKK